MQCTDPVILSLDASVGSLRDPANLSRPRLGRGKVVQ